MAGLAAWGILISAPLAAAAPPTAAEILAGCGAGPDAYWDWVGERDAPTHPFPLATPLVVPLSDDDGDGVVGPGDHPSLVVTHAAPGLVEGRLSLLDAATGATRLIVAEPVHPTIGPAVGDLDGDGLADIVAGRPGRVGLIAFRADGSVLWTSTVAGGLAADEQLALADLDGDGRPEIVAGPAVFEADGSLRFRGAAGTGGHVAEKISHPVDLHPSPGLEVLAGNTLYSASGDVLWRADSLPDGFTSVGDLDGDGSPEIVLAADGIVAVLDTAGAVVAAPWLVPVRVPGRPLPMPLIADVDGDGVGEIVAAYETGVDCLALRGGALELVWTQSASDWSCCGGLTAYDFDHDGAAEILHRDAAEVRVLDGRTGALLWSDAFRSVTRVEHPFVAATAGDGVAAIVASGWGLGLDNAVRVHRCPCTDGARAIWNQHAYHVTNVEDDGTIPRVEAPAWLAPWGWPAQSGGPLGSPCADEERACDACDDLRATVEEAAIDAPGVRRSLLAKVEAACRALDRGRTGAAANVLGALLRDVTAQDGRHVEPESAEAIRACVGRFATARGLILREPRRVR